MLWKLFISDIQRDVAITVESLGHGIIFNIVLIYAMLSVIRVLVYHELNWFMNLNKNVITLAVHIITLIFCGYLIIRKYLRKEEDQKHFGYPVYLSTELTSADQIVRITVLPFYVYSAVFIPVGLSLALELYIGVRLKKLPWLSLKSVTLGHLVMGAFWWLFFSVGQGQNLFNSIRMSMILIILQFLYTVKYRTFITEFTKGLIRLNNSVSTNIEDSDLNDFGIFVGPKEIAEDLELNDYGIFVGPKVTKPEIATGISLEHMPGPSSANPNFGVEKDLVIKDLDNPEDTNTDSDLD